MKAMSGIQAGAKTIVVAFALIGVTSSMRAVRGQSDSPLDGVSIAHIGIIVHDIDATSRIFEEIFGVDVPMVMEYGPLRFHTTVPGSDESLVKVVHFTLGELTLELIEPVRGPGPHQDHLDRFGQGLQHIAFDGVGGRELETIRFLEGKGGKRTMVNYVDLKDVLGFTAEVGTNRTVDAE